MTMSRPSNKRMVPEVNPHVKSLDWVLGANSEFCNSKRICFTFFAVVCTDVKQLFTERLINHERQNALETDVAVIYSGLTAFHSQARAHFCVAAWQLRCG